MKKLALVFCVALAGCAFVNTKQTTYTVEVTNNSLEPRLIAFSEHGDGEGVYIPKATKIAAPQEVTTMAFSPAENQQIYVFVTDPSNEHGFSAPLWTMDSPIEAESVDCLIKITSE